MGINLNFCSETALNVRFTIATKNESTDSWFAALTSLRLSVETGEAGRQRDKVAVCKTKQKVPKSDSF